MAKTNTAPLDDKRMWRKLLKLAHPDAGGDEELFVWVNELKASIEQPNTWNIKTTPVPKEPKYAKATGRPANISVFNWIKGEVDWSLKNDIMATRKQLAIISRIFGMTERERHEFVDIAKQMGLNKSQANKLIEKYRRD